MPMYSWKADDCGRSVDVLRTFADFEQEPQANELPPDFPAPPAGGRVWTRVIAPPLVMKGPGWGGGKGAW